MGLLTLLALFPFILSAQTLPGDTLLKLNNDPAFPWEAKQSSPLFLSNPSNITTRVEYDGRNRQYIIYQKAGSIDYRPPVYMTPEEYRRYEFNQAMREYWDATLRGDASGFRSSLIPQIEVGGETFDRIFGSNVINIVPQGSAELIFGINISHTENPTLSERLRTIPTFDFQEKIQMNVTGTIGDKMQLGINYNTEAMFEFENRTKLEYSGKEDEIIKKIEAGDVTLPLNGTLITGSYSLFGLKTELQFGKMTMTSVFSQQKGESSVVEVKGGSQISDYEITADSYEANRHFFLSQQFRENFDGALSNLPIVSTGLNIEKIEVWITNETSRFEDVSNRNIVAFLDLAENQANIYNTIPEFQEMPGGPLNPSNNTNSMYEQLNTTYASIRNIDQVADAFAGLYPGFQIGRDYEKIENARKLTEREYTINRQLGYISLNIALNNDEVLAVAYEYTLNGQVFKVGEFSTDGITAPDALILKLIKGTTLSPQIPTWKLMMKNIYNVGSGRLEPRDFQVNILYQDDKTGNALNYLPGTPLDGKVLLQALGLDQLNSQLDRQPDGLFDFVEGVTVMADRGRIIFPVLEPFGRHLLKYITDPEQIRKYVFTELYDSTQTVARQMAEKNKYLLRGQFTSATGSEIRLNVANIPAGSVKVTAGGVTLTENVDYTVDYNMGSVKIINSAIIESQTPVQVSLESNQFFGLQTKTLVGTHLNYRFSENFNLGGTVLRLTERPYTQKVTYGEDPISNTIYGFDASYRAESQLLTSAIDWLPFIQTKAPSSINFFGEFAHLVPGHSRAITSEGAVYIDDFEASEISLDLRAFNAWSLASVPQGQDHLFPEARLSKDIRSGMNRALTAWYVIDPLFLRNGSTTPGHIRANPDLQSSHFVREIYETEIFPFKESPSGIPTNISVLNVAFYPEERGPYNFDVLPGAYSAGLNTDGLLNSPRTRWGGMMRELLTNDFESANIQYIKFWVMDPFVENPDHEGGDLYFNLGNISEDILRDSRKQFENGLPNSPLLVNVDTTVWGRVPTVQAVVHAFDNNIDSRRYQDVGLDGLSNEDEASFFDSFLQEVGVVVSPEVLDQILDDPSNDDFHYFRGSDYDRLELGILERYKRFNGTEGNSPTSEMSDESYPTSGTTLPDMEDINRDNTLSETESYYQYHISLRPEDMVVGENFIVDELEYTATFANGEKSPVRWYQFKIPVTDYERRIGSIRDFKSIRFLRMFMRNFDEQVIMRFARLELVRSEWRKYNLTFFEGGERITIPEEDDGTFEISSVSIEENAGKEPVNYVLPPGFDRVIDPANPALRQLNEQSMVLRVRELADGDARATYKTVALDMRQYRRLKMEVHAEALIGEPLDDDEMTVFVRLGSDYRSNFYEYEIPLKLTPYGRYNNDIEEQRAIVWPEANKIDIDLSLLLDAKQARDASMRQPGSSISEGDIYSTQSGLARISVSGNPNLSNVRVVMVGVRNPIRTRRPQYDDGSPRSVEVWINELRLSDFREDGGWAANAQMQARLADLGTVNLVGQTSTPGWGSIDKNVNQRSMEQVIQYDLSSNLELGKFFPEKAGIRIPVYMGFSENRIRPQYDPLDPDIMLNDALDNLETKAERDSLLNLSEEYSRRRTLTVSNAGTTRRGEKPHAWDPANVTVSYAFNEVFNTDPTTEVDVERTYRGGIAYDFDARPKNITPFQKARIFNSPAFRLIKDFNLYLFPKHITVRTDLYRYYNEVKTRNINNPDLLIEPVFTKDFQWTRFYDVKYDITKQLKVDFTASSIARIDEPEGGVDRRRYPELFDVWRDSIMTNLGQFGRTTNYYHLLNLNYNVPVNKLPLLSWVTSNARYSARYDWLAGTIFPDSLNINPGNTIKNSNNGQFTLQANLTNLYNKSKFLKEIETTTQPGARRRMSLGYEEVTHSRRGIPLRAGRARIINHNLKTRDVTITVTASDGTIVSGKHEVVSDTRVDFTPDTDVKSASIDIKGRVEKKPGMASILGRYAVRGLMALRNVSATYTVEQGHILPGYMPGTSLLGQQNYGGMSSPGWRFLVGLTDERFFDEAVINGWITTDTLLNNAATFSKREQINLRGNIEPFPGLRIDVTGDRRYSETISAYLRADRNGNFPDSTRNTRITGNFTISVVSWGTAFEKIPKSGEYVSATFERFRDYTAIISQRRANDRQQTDNLYDPHFDPVTGGQVTGPYASGYGLTSAEVLVPAFLAAYTRRDPEKITLSSFPSMLHIMPNWRINFEGLTKFEAVRKVFNSVSLSHQYRSTYTIGSFNTSLYYDPDESGISRIRDMKSNFIPQYEINTVTINEQFSPFINIDMGWKNSLTTRIEYRKSRTVTLNLASNQVADIRNDEITIGAGYRFDDVAITLRSRTGQRALKSDLNIKLDFSIRDNKTLARKLIEEVNQPVAGQKVFTIGATADYVLSDRFNLQVYADHSMNDPFVANTFLTSNTNFGFSLRFTLVQ
ncbi:MAG TPA: cell surface protein SprA [Bacteroidales bacterium]|nr:cell surface protein SprA [Bacteroidales bacterium]HPJ04962.1 cell surface protein SprA [Bacteroidales bacterium]HPQ63616.1 cell surface protein SprA [Bacteroidales bacterium]